MSYFRPTVTNKCHDCQHFHIASCVYVVCKGPGACVKKLVFLASWVNYYIINVKSLWVKLFQRKWALEVPYYRESATEQNDPLWHKDRQFPAE